MGKRAKGIDIDVFDIVIFDTFKSKLFRWFKGWRYKFETKDYIYFYNKHNSKLIGIEEKFMACNQMLDNSFTNESL